MLGGISIWQLIIILLLIVLLFGTKKLRSLGSDLGGALKDFKKSVSSDNTDTKEEQQSVANTLDMKKDDIKKDDVKKDETK